MQRCLLLHIEGCENLSEVQHSKSSIQKWLLRFPVQLRVSETRQMKYLLEMHVCGCCSLAAEGVQAPRWEDAPVLRQPQLNGGSHTE